MVMYRGLERSSVALCHSRDLRAELELIGAKLVVLCAPSTTRCTASVGWDTFETAGEVMFFFFSWMTVSREERDMERSALDGTQSQWGIWRLSRMPLHCAAGSSPTACLSLGKVFYSRCSMALPARTAACCSAASGCSNQSAPYNYNAQVWIKKASSDRSRGVSTIFSALAAPAAIATVAQISELRWLMATTQKAARFGRAHFAHVVFIRTRVHLIYSWGQDGVTLCVSRQPITFSPAATLLSQARAAWRRRMLFPYPSQLFQRSATVEQWNMISPFCHWDNLNESVQLAVRFTPRRLKSYERATDRYPSRQHKIKSQIVATLTVQQEGRWKADAMRKKYTKLC